MELVDEADKAGSIGSHCAKSFEKNTERKFRGFSGGCDGTFHMFHQVLG